MRKARYLCPGTAEVRPVPTIVRTALDGYARIKREPVLVVIGFLVAVALALMALPVIITVMTSLTLGMLLDQSVTTLQNYRRVFADPAFVTTFKNTLFVGVGTVAVMLFFTIPFCWLYTRTNLPGKNWLLLMLTIKIAIPGFLTAMAYVFLLSPQSGIVNRMAISLLGLERPPFTAYSLWWIVLLQGMGLVTPSFFMMSPAFRALDSALEEGAYVSGVTRITTFFRIALPLLAPAVVAAGVFYFVVAIELFDYAGTLGLPGRIFVFATWIYQATHPSVELPDYGSASAIAVLLAVVAGLALLFYFWAIRRAECLAVVTGRRSHQNLTPLGRLGIYGAWSFIGFFAVMDVAIPVLTLAWSSLVPFLQQPSLYAIKSVSLNGFRFAFQEIGPPLWNTLVLMIMVPTAASLSALCLSWIALRTRLPGRWLVDVIVMISLAVPSIVLGLAFLYLGLSINRIIPIYTTIWIIVLALSVRYMTFCVRTISNSMVQVHKELEEACYSAGVGIGRTFLSVIVPVVRPAVIFSWFWVSLLTLREITIPIMLARPETEVLSTSIWKFQTSGQYSIASAMGMILVTLIAVFALIFHRFTIRQRI